MRRKVSAHVDVRVQTVSKDPHRRDRKFIQFFLGKFVSVVYYDICQSTLQSCSHDEGVSLLIIITVLHLDQVLTNGVAIHKFFKIKT